MTSSPQDFLVILSEIIVDSQILFVDAVVAAGERFVKSFVLEVEVLHTVGEAGAVSAAGELGLDLI